MDTSYIIPYTIPNTTETAYYVTTDFDTNLVFKNHINNMFYQNLQIQSIGQSIYGPYSILLILSSFLLLLAMVAPILLSRNEKTIN
jgi:NADH:ubiquinone oxidoreductase subunit 6 (subunit J)